MEEFLDFFANMPSWQRLLWIIACLSLSWIFEAAIPLKNLLYRKWKHAGVNFVFLATTLLINVAFGVVTVGVFNWLELNEFGILYLVTWPIWLELVIAVLILELFAQYIVHFLLHRVKWMWRLHMVHHSDNNVDATTGTRHHPGDFVLRESFALIGVIVLGAPVAFYMFYRVCTIFFTYMIHANIELPHWLDKGLSYVFITPNVHKFHHHFERPWTDTNFGNITSLWDRLFGTFVYDDPKKIKYGLDVLEGKDDEDIGYQFKLPFDKTIKTDY